MPALLAGGAILTTAHPDFWLGDRASPLESPPEHLAGINDEAKRFGTSTMTKTLQTVARHLRACVTSRSGPAPSSRRIKPSSRMSSSWTSTCRCFPGKRW
jgi:hypothetical protein